MNPKISVYLQEATPLMLQITAVWLMLIALRLASLVISSRGGVLALLRIQAQRFILVSIATIAMIGSAALLIGIDQIILAIAFGIGILISFCEPHLALCFFVANLILRPWEFAPGNHFLALVPKLFAVFSILSFVAYHARQRNLTIIWTTGCSVFILYALWLMLSGLVSGELIGGWEYFSEKFVPVAILSWLALNSLRRKEDLAAIKETLALSVLGIISVASFLTFRDPSYWDPNVNPALQRLEGIGLLSNANDLASLIALAIPLLYFDFVAKGGIGRRLFGLLSLVVLVIALWATQSRGALIAVVLSGIAYLFIGKRTLLRTSMSALVLMLLPIVFFLSIQRDQGDLQESKDSRWNYVVAGVKMARHHPFFGVGIGNYPKYYEQYTPEFIEFGERTAHSTWVLALAEAGIPALGLLALLYLMAINSAWILRQRSPEYLLSLIGYGIAITFLSHTYIFAPYLLIFIVFAAERVERNEASEIEVRVLEPKRERAKIIPLRPVGANALVLASLAISSALLALAPRDVEAEIKMLGSSNGDKPIGASEPMMGSVVKLKGSRGETLNFTVKITGTGGRSCGELRLNLPAKFYDSEFQLFQLETIKISEPSFTNAPLGELFDPLVPIGNHALCLGDKPLWIWGELKIPESVEAGKYNGSVLFGDAQKLPIELTVWKMKIPEAPALPAYMEISSWYNSLGHYGRWTPYEAKLTKRYLDSMKRHRIYSLTTHIQVPKVEWRKGKPELALSNFPSAENSFDAVNIRGRPDWSYLGFPTVTSETINKPGTRSYFEAIGNSAKGAWKENRSLVYLWDEPRTEDFPALKKLASITRSAAPKVKILVTTPYHKSLEKYVDIFAPVMERFEDPDYPSPKEYSALQKKGKEVWWYISCMSHGCDYLYDSGTPDFSIERGAAYVRSIAWLSRKYGVDAFLYYLVNYAYQFYPQRDPWDSLWDFSGNGDGTLFYPGRPGMFGLTEHTPIESIRLKLWREASFDAEYIKWMDSLKTKPEWWIKEFNSLIPSVRTWNRDYTKYQELRDRAGEYLNSLKAEDAE